MRTTGHVRRRIMVPLVAVATLAPATLAVPQDPPPASKPADATEHWRAEAGRYRFTREATPPVVLALRAEPALKWTNPQRRTDDGAVLLWLDRGRPEVAASFYRYPSGGGVVEAHEFMSLATGPIAAEVEGATVWAPQVGGLEIRPIPDAPSPAATPAERLRQLRALAREFRASFNNPPDLSEIRPLTQPLYRYPERPERPDILDGALFAYVHATDPEVLLLIEARAERPGDPMVWHYGVGRMSMVNLKVEHKGRAVWSAVWDNDYRDLAKPYFVRDFKVAR